MKEYKDWWFHGLIEFLGQNWRYQVKIGEFKWVSSATACAAARVCLCAVFFGKSLCDQLFGQNSTKKKGQIDVIKLQKLSLPKIEYFSIPKED